MFGKNLRQELKQYLRHLWPYAIAVVAMSAFACIIVLTDRNPVEATGTMAGIAFFVMAALAFVVRGLTHAFISFYKNISAETVQNESSLTHLLWVPIVAFMIFIVFSSLLLFAGISTFAWKAVGQMFSVFATDWPYFLEFLFFLMIMACTLFIIPTTCVTVFCLSKQKIWPRVLSLIVGIIISQLSAGLLVFEIQFLIHDTSTDLQGLCATTITLLAIFTLVDIGMLLLTYHTLKITIQK